MTHDTLSQSASPAGGRTSGPDDPMSQAPRKPRGPEVVAEALAQLGGAADRARLLEFVTAYEVRLAVAAKKVKRVARGRYCLPDLEAAKVEATRLNGARSHRSAALAHGWELHSPPEEPEIVVARHRDIPGAKRRGVSVRWRPVDADELKVRITSPLRTVIDCARDLPLEESLTIADAALRAGDVTPDELHQAVEELPRTGRKKAERVLVNASSEAANAFESTLRALAIQAVGPILVPQVTLELSGNRVRPDLLCWGLHLVIEADSHSFHTKRQQLVKDCWRYNELSVRGWLVLRFTWDHVMFSPAWVIATIREAVARQRKRGLSP